ncbi:sigma-54-dependent Fis family transcriptional regulator [Siminovitchia acidinfaciens]|uniref:Sigma-54-dependent Fis family transcriptional regulator n=1 Tax=Siminovitchia acidinfaciens TaxID=2321395 RepID=A0A429Y328_9BACI|nr:sigma-54-dependent Fis family transcriptional regulator [Siminovitchia acidinfaciens]
MEVQDSLKNSVWSRFVQEGVLDESRMNKRISESWYICRRDGVNPYNGKGVEVLQQNQFLQRKNANGQLLRAALPLMKKLQKFFAHTKSLFLLVDSDGYVLYMNGDPTALERAGAINFIEGVKWTEKEVGTNAVGTALRTKEPITVIGAEHYAVASQSWGCASSPILNEDGQIAGVLNISYPLEHGIHEHMLPAVASAAYAIEQKLVNIAKDKELELMQCASLTNPQDALTLVCNIKEEIIWSSVHLQKEIKSWHSMDLKAFLNENYTVVEKQPIYSPTSSDLLGYKISLKKVELTDRAKMVSRNPDFQFDGVYGNSESFQMVLLQAERASRTNITVHINGETGTGKEVMARSIHLNSARKDGPFVAVNCGTIPKDLISSELFGYVSGAFTGAKRKGHQGKFQQANSGTLFLDEIAEISQEMQVALLRVLEEKQVVPIGGTKPFPVDVRIITATHNDLTELVRNGDMREDFFYRIYVYPIQLPPLRDRPEDIPTFIYHYRRKYQWNVTLLPEVVEFLQAYQWPGNIRELQNVLDRLRIEFENRSPILEEMKSLINPITNPNGLNKSKQQEAMTYREQIEKAKMMDALLTSEGNVTKAAAKLNISRSTFYRKLKKFNL